MNNNTKLKPFNLERALAGDPVVTRSGEEVESFHLVDANINYPLVVYIKGYMEIEEFTKKGSFYSYEKDSDKDLFMAQVKKEGWVNLYYDTSIYGTNCIYKTKQEAFVHKLRNQIDTVKVEWEEK